MKLSHKISSSISQVSLRIGPTIGVPNALESLGLDPEATLSAAGFDIKLFDDAENLISLQDRGRLIAYCAEKTKCAHFGLLVGKYAGINALGTVGLQMQCSSNVEEALTNLVRYYHLYIQGSTISMRVEGETAILSYSINQQLALGSKQVCAGALAVIYNILTELCGNSWQPTDVCLVQEEPTSIRHYLKTFKLRPNFNAIQNSILFSSHWLTKNLPKMNPMINTLVQEKIKSLEQSCSDDLPNKVRRVLRDSLFNNSCTLEYMSNIFSLNSRTFNRRLADSGVHYQQLVDDIRFEISRQMLSDSEQTINDIALSLHFSDSRSFIRAFKRWSDTTPARWRKSNCINVSS